MIRYLIDSSAIWRVLREAPIRAAWGQVLASGAVGSYHPQRVEFRRSARSIDEFEAMHEMFTTQYPDARIPKSAWTWIEAAQFRLLRHGVHRALSAVDLLICATAAYHGLTVLHDEGDYAAAARHLPDVAERSVRHLPASLG